MSSQPSDHPSDTLRELAKAQSGNWDDLHELAQAQSGQKPPEPPEPPESPEPVNPAAVPAGTDGDADEVMGELDDETVDAIGQSMQEPAGEGQEDAMAAALGAASPRSSYRMAAPPKRKGPGIKGLATPILLTVGVLLLVPAMWAVLYLAGVGVWSSERASARSMALLMLVCWPIAACLIAAGVAFFVQIRREQRKSF